MNKPLSMQEIEQRAPAVFARMPDEERSHRYHFQPTDTLIRLFENLGYFVYAASQQGTADTAKHMLTLRKADSLEIGDAVPQIIIVNAHNGTSSFKLLFGIYRLVCSNGLIVGKSYFEPVIIRHLEVNERAFLNAIRQFERSIPRILEYIERMKNTRLTHNDMYALAYSAAFSRWGNASQFPKDFDVRMLLTSRRVGDTSDDLWTVYNRIQENVMRSGLPRVRGIRSIDKTLDLNKKLWDTACMLLPIAA